MAVESKGSTERPENGRHARNAFVTARQIANGENLLTSGRVDRRPPFNLFHHHPFGYGPAVVPNFDDVTIAKTALAATGANLEGDYVNSYVLGIQIELHSLGSDLWVSFGVAGLVLAAYFARLLLTRLHGLPGARDGAVRFRFAFRMTGGFLFRVLFLAACCSVGHRVLPDHVQHLRPR
jgi:hypothetical protein